MTATTDRCPGCHGSGIEMSGVTYAGMSEYVGCHECGPECPDDCGCRASDATERPESIAPRHPGATQSPDGSQGAPEGPRGAEGAVTDAEAAECARLAIDAELPWSIAVPRLLADRERLTAALASEVEVAEVGKAFHRLVVAERDFERRKSDRLKVQRDGLRATVRSMLGDAAAEGRCGCVALCEGPQEDCPLHGRDYAWWVGLAGTACADRERLTAENAALWAEVGRLSVVADEIDAIAGERDRAHGTAATLEAENARLRAGIEALLADVDRLTAERDGARGMRVIATRAFETTRRVLQEASGLPDDIDDPDCRDEMVLALRPRAEKAEAEVARLREGIEALAAEWGKAGPGTEAERVFGRQKVSVEFAVKALRALLAEGGE